MPDDAFIEQILEPGDKDRSARAALESVVGARQIVEEGHDDEASLTLDELFQWMLKEQDDDTSDMTSSRDEENEPDNPLADILIGYRLQSNNIGERKQQWLKILQFLHSKSQQHATPLRTVVEEHLHEHQILAEAWVALGKQPA